VAKEITRRLIIKERKMDSVWFIPLQFSVSTPQYALSGLEINTLSGSPNEVLQELRKSNLKRQAIYPHFSKMYTNIKTTGYGKYSIHTGC
jgi:hypothetical protein